MPRIENPRQFAEEEFGETDFGHILRTQALVRVGALFAAKPGSKVTEVCSTSADRQAMYKFIENEKVQAKVIRSGSAKAAYQRRKADDGYVLVPFDGTSLKLTDTQSKKNYGYVGAHHRKSTGVQVLNAIGLSADGTPLGLVGQRYWSRKETVKGTRKAKERRALKDKETAHWISLVDEVEASAKQAELTVPLWMQLDRGFDAWAIVRRLQHTDHYYTVRSAYNRAIVEGDTKRYLHEVLKEAPVLYRDIYEVKARQGNKTRKAHCAVRARTVTLLLTDPSRTRDKTLSRVMKKGPSDGVYRVSVCALWVHEEGEMAGGQERLDWKLITNWPVCCEQEAKRVVFNYACRWRIEEMHRLWKSGAMRIEETQVRDKDHLEIVASMTAAVACHLFRLTHLARTDPHRPASEILSHEECLALESLNNRADSTTMTIEQAVFYIAELGGYTGFKNSKGPPGPLVLTRGYKRLTLAADTLRGYLKKRDQW